MNQLCENKDLEIVAFDQKNKRTEKFYDAYSNRIKVHYGDISKRVDLIGMSKNVDFVIHLAAIIPPLAGIIITNPSLIFQHLLSFSFYNFIRSIHVVPCNFIFQRPELMKENVR